MMCRFLGWFAYCDRACLLSENIRFSIVDRFPFLHKVHAPIQVILV